MINQGSTNILIIIQSSLMMLVEQALCLQSYQLLIFKSIHDKDV